MGGIKNKLSKLSNKVKTLLSSPSLTERADERSSSGEVKTNNKSKSSGFCHLIRQTSSATFPVKEKELGSPWVRGAVSRRLTEGSIDRWGRITKYTSLACLTLAILSTLILNIISSYSNSSTRSNAEPVSNGSIYTLANNNDSSTCNPSNTNAASCISLSITSSSSSTDSNNPNLSLQIPREGGIAVGRHTVKVASNNVSGISVSLSVNSDGTASLVNVANPSWSIRSNEKISRPDPDILDNNRWGVALPMDQASAALYESAITNPEQASNLVFSGLPTKNNNEHALSVASNAHGDFTINTYYGVRVDRPENLLAGDYRADVVYTVVTNEVPIPTITSTSSDIYELGSGADGTVIITGTNLSSTYSVYLTNTNGDKIGNCTNLNVTSNTQITCTVPTDQTNPGLEAGDYTIHVVTQGGEETIGFSYTKKTLPDGILESTDDYGEDGHVAVDYDENMIPVTYLTLAITMLMIA